MATPASKNNPGATPTQITSSPHPSAVPMGRPVSHKSPSMRTPSLSGHVHQQLPTTSSHQYPTPLAAGTTVEDAAAFSSPSALLALGITGITPSPAGNEGSVGHGMNENDIPSMGIPSLAMTGPKDSDEEKRKNVEEVINLLRTRVAGRGVCRESVERLGRLEGFECMWQENNLSIAGNSVDLEIEFEFGKESVKDVTLGYATPNVQEGEKREEASAVLKRNLMQSSDDQEHGYWKSITDFHGNLQRLARLDQLSREINCFEAVEGLHESMDRVWKEEERLNPTRSLLEQICTSSIAKPSMHSINKFGLALQYWVDQRHVVDSKLKSANGEDISPSKNISIPENTKIWNAVIECETGYPPLRISKEWVGSEVFATMNDNGEQDNGNVVEIKLINWIEPPETLVSGSVALETALLASTPPNVRFVARLEPPVDVPIMVASDVYRLLGANLPQDLKPSTFDSLVIPAVASRATTRSDAKKEEGKQLSNEHMRNRDVPRFDENGTPVKSRHSYTFHAVEHVPGRTLRDLPFSHPRQIADVVPILRQYALLSTLLRRIFDKSKDEIKQSEELPKTKDSHALPKLDSGSTFISNMDPAEYKLKSLLSNFPQRTGIYHESNAPPSPYSQTASQSSTSNEIRVDVSLKTPLSSPPSILLLFKIPGENAPEAPTATLLGRSASRTITIRIDIGLNGNISIPTVTGLWPNDHSDNSKNLGAADRETRTQKVRQKLEKVIETCEDVGLLVEWIIRWVKQQSSSEK